MNSIIDLSKTKPENVRLKSLANVASGLGFELVDLAAVLDKIDDQAKTQLRSFAGLHEQVEHMANSNADVRQAVSTVAQTTQKTFDVIDTSVNDLRRASDRAKLVAKWVQSVDRQMRELSGTLKAVQSNNNEITAIARQVNILAINAKIEAVRAGDAGRGFAVVAEAINELSQETASAADEITQNINGLSKLVTKIGEESSNASSDANSVLKDAEGTDKALISISAGVKSVQEDSKLISTGANRVYRAIHSFEPEFTTVATAIKLNATNINLARNRANALIDQSEMILQKSVSLGGATDDTHFIEFVKKMSRRVSTVFEEAIKHRQLNESDLFSNSYEPIPGTDPVQYKTLFTQFCDSALYDLFENALSYSPKIIYCTAIDRNGYTPTHNKKFSQPQGKDPVWNMTNSRNRQIFNDRAGLKAGNNREDFLLQVYRRDMGGGVFKLIKYLSAPISVNGKHWGGVRMAYTA